MTQNTEQERAEFEREMAAIFTHTDFEVAPEGHYENPITGTWLLIWQAARRAPSAPVPQEWRELAQRCLTSMEDAVHFRKTGEGRPPEQTCLFEIEDLRAALAAAPQPTEAAPVEFPEPDAWRYTDARGHFRYRGARPGFAVEYPILKPDALYTEQQVHQLLADHAAKESP